MAIQEEGQAQGRVDQNVIDAERVAALAESVDATEERLAGLERRARIYELTLAAIDRAEQVTMKTCRALPRGAHGRGCGPDHGRPLSPGRGQRAGPHVPGLVAGGGDWVSVQQLSRGTLDQVYLAARLGLVRQVTQEKQPPLIFDDPFVTFDEDRARRAAELLRDLARDHQVLYLTTSDRYDSVADSVVVLPGPTLREIVEVRRRRPVPRPERARCLGRSRAAPAAVGQADVRPSRWTSYPNLVRSSRDAAAREPVGWQPVPTPWPRAAWPCRDARAGTALVRAGRSSGPAGWRGREDGPAGMPARPIEARRAVALRGPVRPQPPTTRCGYTTPAAGPGRRRYRAGDGGCRRGSPGAGGGAPA